MSTIFRDPPSPSLLHNSDDSHYRSSRSLHQNCFLAPPHSRNPPTSHGYGTSLSSIDTPLTPPSFSLDTQSEKEYFSLDISGSSTPVSDSQFEISTPDSTAKQCSHEIGLSAAAKSSASSGQVQFCIEEDAVTFFEGCLCTDVLHLVEPPHHANQSMQQKHCMASTLPGNHVEKAVERTAGVKIVGATGSLEPRSSTSIKGKA
jgi:hypothetical protein